MAEKTDYYKILGVEKTASADEIKKAGKKLFKLHPDNYRNKSADEQKAAEILYKDFTEALAVLSDANKRAAYDRGGFDAAANAGKAQAPTSVQKPAGDFFDAQTVVAPVRRMSENDLRGFFSTGVGAAQPSTPAEQKPAAAPSAPVSATNSRDDIADLRAQARMRRAQAGGTTAPVTAPAAAPVTAAPVPAPSVATRFNDVSLTLDRALQQLQVKDGAQNPSAEDLQDLKNKAAALTQGIEKLLRRANGASGRFTP